MENAIKILFMVLNIEDIEEVVIQNILNRIKAA